MSCLPLAQFNIPDDDPLDAKEFLAKHPNTILGDYRKNLKTKSSYIGTFHHLMAGHWLNATSVQAFPLHELDVMRLCHPKMMPRLCRFAFQKLTEDLPPATSIMIFFSLGYLLARGVAHDFRKHELNHLRKIAKEKYPLDTLQGWRRDMMVEEVIHWLPTGIELPKALKSYSS